MCSCPMQNEDCAGQSDAQDVMTRIEKHLLSTHQNLLFPNHVIFIPSCLGLYIVNCLVIHCSVLFLVHILWIKNSAYDELTFCFLLGKLIKIFMILINRKILDGKNQMHSHPSLWPISMPFLIWIRWNTCEFALLVSCDKSNMPLPIAIGRFKRKIYAQVIQPIYAFIGGQSQQLVKKTIWIWTRSLFGSLAATAIIIGILLTLAPYQWMKSLKMMSHSSIDPHKSTHSLRQLWRKSLL